MNKAGPMFISLPIACNDNGWPKRETKNKAPCFVIPNKYKSLYIQHKS